MFMLPMILSDYRAVRLAIGSHHRASNRIPLLTVELGVQFLQIGGDSGDQTLHRRVGRADLKSGVVCQHRQDWKINE